MRARAPRTRSASRERAEVEVEGIKLSQLRIAKDRDPYPSVLAWLTTKSADQRVVAEK